MLQCEHTKMNIINLASIFLTKNSQIINECSMKWNGNENNYSICSFAYICMTESDFFCSLCNTHFDFKSFKKFLPTQTSLKRALHVNSNRVCHVLLLILQAEYSPPYACIHPFTFISSANSQPTFLSPAPISLLPLPVRLSGLLRL